jgi:hypothetical protein
LVELKVYPQDVNLSCKQDRQSIVVQAAYKDGATRDVTSEATFTPANPSLVRIDRGLISPLVDGKTEIAVRFEGRTVNLPVSVERAQLERPISFKLDVMPIFMKAGCNSGACHG